MKRSMRLPISYNKPYDLAKSVCNELQRRALKCPEIALVNSIFETLFFASLKTEESHEITCHIVYLDPKHPDPKPPDNKANDRWSYVPLEKEVPFSVTNLVKIAQASDPRTSSFVIYPNRIDDLYIWGFIDQGNRYHEHLIYNTTTKPDRPGVFQASIIGKGHLVTYIAYEKIAELKTEKLIKRSNDVLRRGPIHDQILVEINKFTDSVINDFPNKYDELRNTWSSSLHDDWISTICRLLLRTQSYHHGGAFLITPDLSEVGLNIKYRINYSRIYESLIRRSTLNIKRSLALDDIWDNEIIGENHQISPEHFFEKNLLENEFNECSSELDGCIWFISLLSRVDGLVLLKPDLTVRGFGVEITDKDDIEHVFKASGPLGTFKGLHSIDYHEFGTRHRSMMRYCYKNKNSIGFVCSQDGDVRVITNLNNRVVIWDNIRLQLDDFVDIRKIRDRNLKNHN